MASSLGATEEVPDYTVDGWPLLNEEPTSATAGDVIARPALHIHSSGPRSPSSPSTSLLSGSAIPPTGHSALTVCGTTWLQDKNRRCRGKLSHGCAPMPAEPLADLAATATPPTEAWPVAYSSAKSRFRAPRISVSAEAALLTMAFAWPTSTTAAGLAAHRFRRRIRPLWS
ncbi:uncharacterized protein LOC144102252 isoform X1 [Amblyomma americanum]